MPERGALHHVEIYVSDLARSVEFWGWLLERFGYESYQTWNEGRSWRLGDTYLVFVQSTELGAGFNRRRVGLNHLAFHASDRAEVDVLKKELLGRGERVLYDDKHPDAQSDYYALYFEDPDGIKVEVVAP